MLDAALRLASRAILSPVRAAGEAREKPELGPALAVYAAFLLAYWAFFTWKPLGFPETGAPGPGEVFGAGYWLKVLVWQPFLEAAWIAFLVALCAYFAEGRLPVKLVAAAAWWAALLLLIVGYAQLKGLSKPAFALGSLAAYAPFAYLLWRAPRDSWKGVAAFMLELNAIGLVLFVPMAVAAWLEIPRLYFAAQIGGGFWVLGAGALGLRELTGLRLPRAFMALLLSMFFQILLPLVLYLLGVVPREILKALFYG